MKYLKYFTNESDYNTFKTGSDYVTPNVSYAVDSDKVFYGPAILSYNAVDLGLSVKWADRNIGATQPEDNGLYFQWGDTTGYTADQVGVDKVFNWDNYWDTTDGGSTFTKYTEDTTLEASDDAAVVNMGSDWRMPTLDEMNELLSNTTPTFIDLDGNEFTQEEASNSAIEASNLKGVRLTGSNGNSIFLPATGFYHGSTLNSLGYSGWLWSSSLDPSYSQEAQSLNFFYDGFLLLTTNTRMQGLPIRGVIN